MKLSHAIFGLLVVGLLPLPLARADVPPLPRDLPDGKSFEELEVKVDPNKDISFLRIPRSALGDAGLDIRDKKKEETGALTPSAERSVVAALAMSLGIAGVFFARKKRGAAIAVALVSATVVGAIGVQAWGDLAPFPRPRPRPEAPVAAGGTVTLPYDGHVVIQIVEEGPVQLTIGTKPLPKYKRALPPGQSSPPNEETR